MTKEKIILSVQLCWTPILLKERYKDSWRGILDHAEHALAGICLAVIWVVLLVSYPILPLIVWAVSPLKLLLRKQVDWKRVAELVEEKKGGKP